MLIVKKLAEHPSQIKREFTMLQDAALKIIKKDTVL